MAVISGADRISGWQPSNASKDIWAALIPAGLRTRQIYVNGSRASLAAGEVPVNLQRLGMGYAASSAVMVHWRNPRDIDFVYPSQLSYPAQPICPVASINGKVITMAQPCWDNSNYRRRNLVGWGGGILTTPAYIENAYELLDQPGQFYLDPTAHILYYIPRPRQDMRTADVEAPILQSLVTGQGSATAPIHNITFSNLQFSYATWMQPNTPEGFSEQQSNYTVTGKHGYATQGLCKLVPHGMCPYGAWTKEPGNVQFSYDQNLSFIDDRFVHLGAAGLNLDNGSQNDTVAGSVFTDISGNGLEIGSVNMPEATGVSQTTNIMVSDNHLYGLPAEYPGGTAILVGYAASTTISHNQIDHTPCMAISIGWGGWLDKLHLPPVPNFSHDNVVSDNLIFDFMQVLKDGGGIYTQGIQGSSMTTGLHVTGNVIHDQLDWGGALKADNGTTYVAYVRNVLYNDTYDWDGVHWDYRAKRHPKGNDPELIKDNWWQQGYGDGSTKGVTLSGNKIVAGPDQVPTSVLANAGVEPGFRSILSWHPAGDSVPSSPEEVSGLYAFHGKAYVTWHPSYVEGSSPVLSYTLRTCRDTKILNQEGCGLTTVPPVTVSADKLDQLGYAVVSGLTDGQRYRFTVTANNVTGSSIPSLPSWTIRPRGYAPGLLYEPTHVGVQIGRKVVSLIWYRPRNDPGVALMSVSSNRTSATEQASRGHLLVLSYVVTSSARKRYPLTGHEQLIDTNTGSRVVEVIGGLVGGRYYKFSIGAVNPAGVGRAISTGWVKVQS